MEMGRPMHFEPVVNFGHLLVLSSVIVIVSVAAHGIRQTLLDLGRQSQDLARQIGRMEASLRELERRTDERESTEVARLRRELVRHPGAEGP